jgi:ATP-dependent helicase HrpB
LPSSDPLSAERFLVVAELDAAARDSRIRQAAALDEADVERAAGASVEERLSLEWDAKRDDLRARTDVCLGSLVLRAVEGPAPGGPVTVRALLARVRATRLAVLSWTDAARSLQRRVAFARRIRGDAWPDLTDRALLDSLDDWLAPALATATGRRDLEALDVEEALRRRLGRVLVAELARLAPETLPVAGGRRRAGIDYAPDQPTVAVRVQDLFGTTVHPTVGDGRVPLVVQLLSPADRPVQVTTDLPRFWAGSWAEVRKEMAGRYPKHEWPADPASAIAARGSRRPGDRQDLRS